MLQLNLFFLHLLVIFTSLINCFFVYLANFPTVCNSFIMSLLIL